MTRTNKIYEKYPICFISTNIT